MSGYKLSLNCAYCDQTNHNIIYYDDVVDTGFKCIHCKKKNQIVLIFEARKPII